MVERCPDKTEVPGSIPGAPISTNMQKITSITIVFFTGKPACGKNTQAKLLSKKLDFEVITTSEEIKNFINSFKKKYLKIGKIRINIQKQKKIMEKGKLASYRLVSYIILNVLKKKIKEKKNIIFAGSPRSLFEAKTYLNFLKNFQNVKILFFYLKISDKTAIKRALGRKEKRPDDNLKSVKLRLKVFKKEIKPMLDWLKKRKLLIEINGEKSQNEVHKDVLKYIQNEKI